MPGDQSEGHPLTVRVRSISGDSLRDQLSVKLLMVFAFFVTPSIWPLSPLAGSVLIILFVLLTHWLARARFQPKEIEVEAGRLTIRTYNGYSRVVNLERPLGLRSFPGIVELTGSRQELIRLFLRKRPAKSLVDFLVSEFDLVPMGRGGFEERSVAQNKAAHLRPRGRLVCPACERERPSEYWFQTPEGVATDICNECSVQATAPLASA